MIKIAKIYPRDIIAVITLIACFVLMYFGINHVVAGIAIAVIAFYFSKRLYEERNPNGDLNERVRKLENNKTIIAKFADVPKKTPLTSDTPVGPLTTGDFKPVSKTPS